MSRKISAILLSLSFLISLPGLALGDVVKDIAKKAADAAFSEAERQAIKKYYEITEPIRGAEREREREYEQSQDSNDEWEGKGNTKNKGKGKGKGNNKKKDLPRGIVKKLERGGSLPPGMEKRGLPSDLEQQLPPAPRGYERIVSEGKVVLADKKTGVIADIVNIGEKAKAGKTKEKPAAKSNTRNDPPQEAKAPEKTPENSDTPAKTEKKWWKFWGD